MNEDRETVILVDAWDREVEAIGKMEAHRLGMRHRAISVCITNRQGDMLLQRHAIGKYHSGGLWTNACCTHSRVGEAAGDAALRRIEEELGAECRLSFLGVTHYRAAVGAELVENEVVHLFHREYDGGPRSDAGEVKDFGWFSRQYLLSDVERRPDSYTCWFRHYLYHHGDEIFQGAA